VARQQAEAASQDPAQPPEALTRGTSASAVELRYDVFTEQLHDARNLAVLEPAELHPRQHLVDAHLAIGAEQFQNFRRSADRDDAVANALFDISCRGSRARGRLLLLGQIAI